MSQVCKNICHNMAVPVKRIKGFSMYVENKHCSTCSVVGTPIFLKIDDNICPCCRSKLGTRPKTKREKEVYDTHMKSLIISKIRSKK